MDVFSVYLLGALTAIWVMLLLAVIPRDRYRRPRLLLDVTTTTGETFYGVIHMKLLKGQKVLVSVRPVDADGNAAELDGDVQFSSSDESVAVVEIANGRSAYVVYRGPGEATIQAVADARLGEEVKEIVATGVVTCAAGEAVGMELVFGTPEDTLPPQ